MSLVKQDLTESTFQIRCKVNMQLMGFERERENGRKGRSSVRAHQNRELSLGSRSASVEIYMSNNVIY